MYSLFVSLLLYLLFESVWSNVLSLMFRKRPSLRAERDRTSDRNQSKLNELTNGKTRESDFTINRFSVTNGANKWPTNGSAKDMNGNVEEYRVVSGNVYVDMGHVSAQGSTAGLRVNVNPSLNGIHSQTNTKL